MRKTSDKETRKLKQKINEWENSNKWAITVKSEGKITSTQFSSRETVCLSTKLIFKVDFIPHRLWPISVINKRWTEKWRAKISLSQQFFLWPITKIQISNYKDPHWNNSLDLWLLSQIQFALIAIECCCFFVRFFILSVLSVVIYKLILMVV